MKVNPAVPQNVQLPAAVRKPAPEATAQGKKSATLTGKPVTLSPDSFDALARLHQDQVHGKSQNSPAHQARQAIAGNPALDNLPFGKIVSQIARGLPLPEAGEMPESGEADEIPGESVLGEAPDMAETGNPDLAETETSVLPESQIEFEASALDLIEALSAAAEETEGEGLA